MHSQLPTLASLCYRIRPANFCSRLGDIINRFRKSIDLEEVAMFDGPFLTKTLKIPFTYCWSPALVPKPADWPSHIGNSFQDLFA